MLVLRIFDFLFILFTSLFLILALLQIIKEHQIQQNTMQFTWVRTMENDRNIKDKLYISKKLSEKLSKTIGGHWEPGQKAGHLV